MSEEEREQGVRLSPKEYDLFLNWKTGRREKEKRSMKRTAAKGKAGLGTAIGQASKKDNYLKCWAFYAANRPSLCGTHPSKCPTPSRLTSPVWGTRQNDWKLKSRTCPWN